MTYHKAIKCLLLVVILFSNTIVFGQNTLPKLFLFLGKDQAGDHEEALKNPCVSGVQIIYSWKQLEPEKNQYDFSKIEADLAFLNKIHKRLFIQLQDRSFEPTVFNVPNYIRNEKIYHGGIALQYDFAGEGKPITTGWVARVWDPTVKKRFHLLIQKLASQFDGKIYGINLPETAIDFPAKNYPLGFTPDNYFYAELENMGILRKAFRKSVVIQYVNFFPNEWNNDKHYMRRFFSYAMNHHIGLGNPDTVPYRKEQMKNSYPLFHKFKNQILVGTAIQEPDYTYKNPETGRSYKFADFYNFSQKYLGATILFWNVQEPFFSQELAVNLNPHYFNCN